MGQNSARINGKLREINPDGDTIARFLWVAQPVL